MIIKLWFLTYTNYLNRLMSLVSGICVRPGWHPAIEFWYIKFWNLFILFNLYIFGKLFCVNRIAWIFIYVFLLLGFNENEYLSIENVSSVADPLIVCATTLLECHAQDPKLIYSLCKKAFYILRLTSTTHMLCIEVRLAPTVWRSNIKCVPHNDPMGSIFVLLPTVCISKEVW